MSHYIMSCFGPEDREATGIHRIPRPAGVSWITGQRLQGLVPEPLDIYLNPELPGVMLPMYYKGVLVMSDAMVGALRQAGVANLEVFDTRLHDPFLGEVRSDYKVVNIVGVVNAADLGRSQAVVHGEATHDVDFDSLVLDEAAIAGLDMFRLAENLTGIVISDRVKAALEQANIEYLDLSPPAEWLG